MIANRCRNRIPACLFALTLGCLLLAAVAHPAVESAFAGEGGEGGGGGNGNGSSGQGNQGQGNQGQGNQGQGKGQGNQGQGNSGSAVPGSSDEAEAGEDGAGQIGASDDAASGRSAEERWRYVASEVVVVDQQEANLAGMSELGFSVLDRRPLGALGLTVTRLRAPPGMSAPEAQALLQRTFPEIVTDLNALYAAQGQEALPSPAYPRQLIGWTRSSPQCGQGIRLGLVDTGIDRSLPIFAGRHIEERSFLDPGRNPAATGHGSAVAGLLVGASGDGGDSGLLPAAELRVATIFEEAEPGLPVASVVTIARALDWLVAERVSVINLSLAGEGNALLALAVRSASEQGAVLVSAAGNGGPDAPPAYPAGYPEVLAVTAIDAERQPAPDGARGSHIDFAAPGVRVWAPGPEGGGYQTGSSFAAPFVTAAAAALLPDGDRGDHDRIEAELARKALDLGAPGRDPVFGWGLVQSAESCGATAASLPEDG